MAAEAEQGFRPLDEASLLAYIKATPALSSRLGGGGSLDSIEIKEVGDGNLNFVYIVQSEAGAMVVKQVRPSPPQHTRSSSLLILTLTAPGAGENGTRRRSRTCAAWGTRGP
jgi:5-methylthioribose kinase